MKKKFVFQVTSSKGFAYDVEIEGETAEKAWDAANNIYPEEEGFEVELVVN